MAEDTETEVAAIAARLEDELRRPGGTSPSSQKLAARSRAERAWPVSAERPIVTAPHRGRVWAFVVVPTKRALRKLMRWYVEPVAAQQRSFNLAVLNLVDELDAQYEAELSRLERRLEVLEGPRHGRGEPDG